MSSTAQEIARCRQQLLGFAMARLRDRDRAEDAVQDALVAGLENLHRFAGGSSLRTWLTGILKHKIADAGRRAAREEPAEPEELPAPGDGPEGQAARRRMMESLERDVARLPRTLRQVFVMSDLLELETREICARLAISPGHCWVALHRARKRLRDSPDILAHR